MLVSIGGSIYYGHEAAEKPDVLLQPERRLGEWLLTNPSFGPDGDRFLYTVLATNQKDDAVFDASVTGLLKEQLLRRRGRRLFPAETHAEFMTPTCLIFGHKGWLLAQPYDAARDQPTSKPPIPLRIGGRIGRAEWTHRGAFSVTTGRIAYFTESATPVSLVEVSGDKSEPRTLDATLGTQNPEASPDGRRVVFEVRPFVGQNRNLYSIDRAGGKPQPLTSDSGDNADPVWSRSGEILFSSNRTRPRSLYLLTPGVPLGRELLVGGPKGSRGITPNSWAPDGRVLVSGTIDDYSGLFLLDSPSAKEPSLRIRDAGAGQFSPGRGDWIAYQARNRYGHLEVFVTRSDGSTVGAPLSVSRGKGCRPRWASDGRQIFFVTDTGLSGGDRLLMAASFGGRTGLIGKPRLRSRHRLLGPLSRGNYALWPDMHRLMVINSHDPDPPYHEIIDLR